MKELGTVLLFVLLAVLLALPNSVNGLEEFDPCYGFEGVNITSIIQQATDAYLAEDNYSLAVTMLMLFAARGTQDTSEGVSYTYEGVYVYAEAVPTGWQVSIHQDTTDENDVPECALIMPTLPDGLLPYSERDLSKSA